MAMNTAAPARSNFRSMAATIAEKPPNNAPVVSRFGSQYTPRGRAVRSSSSLMSPHDTRGADVSYAAMRLSQNPISTLKEVPADAEVISHRLMLRAGMIRRLAAGLYLWLPLGLRTLLNAQ